MIYIIDFLKFLFEQFSFIFDFIGEFISIISYLDIVNPSTGGLPSWLVTGLGLMVLIPCIFRITQIIPVIGGFDS